MDDRMGGIFVNAPKDDSKTPNDRCQDGNPVHVYNNREKIKSEHNNLQVFDLAITFLRRVRRIAVEVALRIRVLL